MPIFKSLIKPKFDELTIKQHFPDMVERIWQLPFEYEGEQITMKEVFHIYQKDKLIKIKGLAEMID